MRLLVVEQGVDFGIRVSYDEAVHHILRGEKRKADEDEDDDDGV